MNRCDLSFKILKWYNIFQLKSYLCPFKVHTYIYNELNITIIQCFQLSVFIWCPQLIVCVSLSAVGRVYLYRKSSLEGAMPHCEILTESKIEIAHVNWSIKTNV